MPKSPDAFRTISEVADWLGLQAHVLRFWESKFAQVKPVKRAGGRRYYRPADMLLLGGIKKLLHEDGMTIKGAQKLLREKGVSFVADQSQPLDDLTMAVIEEDVPATETDAVADAAPAAMSSEPEATSEVDVEPSAVETFQPPEEEPVAALDPVPPSVPEPEMSPGAQALTAEHASVPEPGHRADAPEPATPIDIDEREEAAPEQTADTAPDLDTTPVVDAEPAPEVIAEPAADVPTDEIPSPDGLEDLGSPEFETPSLSEDTAATTADVVDSAPQRDTPAEDTFAPEAPTPEADPVVDSAEPELPFIPAAATEPTTSDAAPSSGDEATVETPPPLSEDKLGVPPLPDPEPLDAAVETPPMSEPEVSGAVEDNEDLQDEAAEASEPVDADAPVQMPSFRARTRFTPSVPQAVDDAEDAPEPPSQPDTEVAPDTEAEPDVGADDAPTAALKPNVVDVPPVPDAKDIAVDPAALSMLARINRISPEHAREIKPLVARLTRLRASMANPRKDVHKD